MDNKKEFINDLILANFKAGVDKQLTELLAAYAHLCIKNNMPVEFYRSDSTEEIKSKYPLVRQFIKNNQHLDSRSLEFLANYAELLRVQKLPIIFNLDQLASYLSISTAQLNTLCSNSDDNYRVFSIPKKNGARRQICEPNPELKSIQARLLKGMLESVPLHSAATAFRRKRSITNNAVSHVDKNIVIRIDLKDFFPSIPVQRVQAVFENMGYSKTISQALAKLMSFKGRLPMGTPTSPYLSNIVAMRLDRRFEKLGLKSNFHYSRYADDLIFSSNNKSLNNYLPIFKNIIEDEGFSVNQEKLKIMRSGAKQQVTGVVVNKKVNIEREQYRKLKAVLHNCYKDNPKNQVERWGAESITSFKNQLLGHINFVAMLDKDKGTKLLKDFQRIKWVT